MPTAGSSLKLFCVIAVVSVNSLAAAQHVAPTDPLSPVEQQKRFKLPAGFEIQLIAAEKDIGQPMNLNFDVRGRLWVTSSVEYPYPAKGEGVQPRGRFPGVGDHPPRDRLTVIAGIGPDGKPNEISHFVDGLNIPIGQSPLGDGSRAIVYGIPSIYLCRDTDNDGQADEQTPIYSGFGNIDTHGMASSFTRWIDGWIYGCHGFSNTSEVRDGKGRVTRMKSGNTYRFREDGSHFEQFTWGQVNPFGMTFDPLGNLYVSDCHSMPVYMLLRGARYPHFGDQADGMGFGPKMINHSHGSTGICGPAYYAADHFPATFRDNLFICNPVTGRVHRDRLKRFGSTYQCDTQPDFVTCGDPWFRPVDCIVGPDGALYIADFYNAVIGHYEVPLAHPKRDRTHGRVWRVVYRGEDGKAAPPPLPDLTKLSAEHLVARLADPNLQVRVLATNYLVDAHAKEAITLLKASWAKLDATQRAHALWILQRLEGMDDELLKQLAHDESPLVRLHTMKALAERSKWGTLPQQIVLAAAGDADAFVQRAAADALGRHPRAENVAPLLATWAAAPAEDTHLNHTIRLALREHLRDAPTAAAVARLEIEKAQRGRLLEIATATGGPQAAALLLIYAEPGMVDASALRQAAEQIAGSGSADQLAVLLKKVPRWFADDPSQQFALFSAIHEGLSQRPLDRRQQAEMRAWLSRLAPPLLSRIEEKSAAWTNRPVPGLRGSESPWGLRERTSADGQTTLVIDSIVHGEQRTGIYRSRVFTIPEKLTFWMCGHNGRPGTNPTPVNYIRLVLAGSGRVIAREVPPRNDTAQKYTWSVKDHAGERGAIEIVDADTAGAYAWIGVGRFEPAVVEMPADRAQTGARLVHLMGKYGATQFGSRVLSLVSDAEQSDEVRIAAAVSSRQLGKSKESLDALSALVSRPENSAALRGQAAQLLAAEGSNYFKTLLAAMATAPAEVQTHLAIALCSSRDGTEELLSAIRAGKASARLLQDARVAQNVATSATPQMKQQAAALLEGLPTVEQQVVALIAARQRGYFASDNSPQRGREVFVKNCAACHRVGGEGGKVGPQLDGIGNRGLDRVLEDVLDPNRNVDPAFRSTTIVTTAGRVHSGLALSDEGKTLVLADAEGKEIRIPRDEIEERQVSPLSAMPANVGERVKEVEFFDLMSYLLSQRAKGE